MAEPDRGKNATPPSHTRLPLSSVLATAELDRRPARPADFQAESYALHTLMQAMASSPTEVLHELARTAVSLCGAHCAGISILEEEQESGLPFFRWLAVAGGVSTVLSGTMPRWDSPCGTALDHNAAILLQHPQLHFDFPPDFGLEISEVLLVPFTVPGSPVGMLWVIARDESRRFDREDERILSSLGKFAAAFVQHPVTQQTHFRAIFDSIPTAIYTTDAIGRLTYFNPAAAALAGRTPSLGLDQWCVSWKLYFANGAPMPAAACPMALAMQQGRPIEGVEAILERPDGSRVWFSAYPTPLRDDQGRIVAGINTLVDISDRRRAKLGPQGRGAPFETLVNQHLWESM